MDVSSLIADLQKHDKEMQISHKDLRRYVSDYAVYIVIILLGSALVSWLLLESFSLFLILVTILLITFYSYILDRETTIQNTVFADKHGLLWRKRMRVSKFGLRGVVFGVGHSARSYNSFISTNSPTFGVFNYRFKTGSGKNTRTHDYVAAYFDLPKELPHILLDSKKNDGLLSSSIPRFLDKEYIVSLEGDFDKHFTLYTAFPKPAEVLTILSPDVMQTLITQTPEIDIEIVNRRLWAYIPNKKNYRSYATALQAGLYVLKSANNNLKHYKMDDLVSLAKQEANQKKLYSKGTLVVAILVVIYLIFNLVTILF